jgi:ribosomal protein S18 acetylase RimI-like enzyme
MHMTIADTDRGIHGLVGKLSVKVGTRIRLIGLMNILYVQACGDYVDIATVSGETLHTKEQITRLESRLPAYLFARMHRSYIVNTEYVQEIRTRQNDYDLVLSNGTVIASSSVYRKLLRERFLTNRGDDLEARGAPGNDDHARPELRSIPGIQERLRVRACVPGDEASLVLLGQTTFMETFAGLLKWEDILAYCASHHTPEFYRAWLEDQRSRIWMLESEASAMPVGYLALTPANLPVAGRRDDDLEIQRLYLRDRYRDRGLDARLLSEALRHAQDLGCRRIWGGDYEKNDRILKFYERAGFNVESKYTLRVGSTDYRDLAMSLEI